jgi:hypothetical protein
MQAVIGPQAEIVAGEIRDALTGMFGTLLQATRLQRLRPLSERSSIADEKA